MLSRTSTPVRNPTASQTAFGNRPRPSIKEQDPMNFVRSTRSPNYSKPIPTGNLRHQPDSAGHSPDINSESDEDDQLDFRNQHGTLDHNDDDENWDTDLEEHDSRDDYDASGKTTYISACRECGVIPVSYYVRHMTETKLQMQHHGVGVMGARAMAIALVTNTYVLHLNLADNALGPIGTGYICEMLKENCYITDLDLSENKIGLEGVAAISDVMANTSNLKTLSLAGNELESKCASILAEAIKVNTSIKRLDLSHNCFEEQGGQFLGPAIAMNEYIEEIDLSWNHLRHKGAFSIALSLKENTILKVLNLAWNGFSNDGALAVGDALKVNTTLTELDLSNNRVTSEGASHLNKGLMVNDALKVLRVGQNPMQSQGAYLILSTVKNNPNIALLEIELTDIQVNSDFYELLRELSDLFPELTVLHGGAGGAHGKAKPRPKPMKVLKDYIKSNQMRLFDFFSMMDKDKSMSISVTEFANGLKENGLSLNGDELLKLVQKLDRDKDGEINYSELVLGSIEQLQEDRREVLKEKARKERERKILSHDNLRPDSSLSQRSLSGRSSPVSRATSR